MDDASSVEGDDRKRPQHHLQASVPPAPSPVLHQASTCGLHLWPAEKPRIMSVPANNTGGKRDWKESDSLRWIKQIGSVIVM